MKIEKLEGFFKNSSYKNKVMLYLFAKGYSVTKISKITKKEIVREFDEAPNLIKEDFLLLVEEMSNSSDDDFGLLHSYPKGKKISSKRILENFHRAFKYVPEVETLDDFKAYIS